MGFDVWTVYAGTVLLMMITPGPSQLLMLSNSMAHGFRPSLATAAGDLTANILQMLAAGLGVAAVIAASQTAFLAIKWAGVAYLVYLGVKQIWNASRGPLALGGRAATSRRRLWLQGFVTSAANPKAVVFFAALFPQFIVADASLAPQLFALGLTYLIFDATFLTAYGLAGDRLARRLVGGARLWLERIAGGFLIGAAILLGLKSPAR